MYAAHVHVTIRFVLVATALYRYVHREMELLRFKGKIMNLRRIYESEKNYESEKRFVLTYSLPKKVFSSCDKQKNTAQKLHLGQRAAATDSEKAKPEFRAGKLFTVSFFKDGDLGRKPDFHRRVLLESRIVTKPTPALSCTLVRNLPPVGDGQPGTPRPEHEPPARVGEEYAAPGCPRLALMLKSVVLPTSPRCQFAAISFV